MTLISAYSYSGVPILFGDLLVTGPTSNNHTVHVPALGDVSVFFGGSGWGVSELTQKVNLISNNCAIAWAGSYIGARLAIRNLRNLVSSKNLTCEEILRYLESEPELRHHPASFVGLNCFDNQIQQFQWGAETVPNTSLGTIYMSGSGSYVMQEFVEFQASMELQASGEVNSLALSITSGLILGGMLLRSEYHGRDIAPTILHAFGGGYEIAFSSKGSIQKLSEVTYILWEASLNSERVRLSHPLLIVKKAYVKDYLLIQSAQIQHNENTNSLNIVNEQRHVIKPLFEPETPVSVDLFNEVSFQSRLFCHCISVQENGQSIGIHTEVRGYSPTSEMPISITDTGNRLVLGLRHDLIMELFEVIEQYRR